VVITVAQLVCAGDPVWLYSLRLLQWRL